MANTEVWLCEEDGGHDGTRVLAARTSRDAALVWLRAKRDEWVLENAATGLSAPGEIEELGPYAPGASGSDEITDFTAAYQFTVGGEWWFRVARLPDGYFLE